MNKCFFTTCKKEVNHRGKFCEEHDKKEKDTAKKLEAIFKSNKEKI